MLSAVIHVSLQRHPHLATQRFPLAGELVYYWCVLPGPLVLWKAPLNALTITPDMDRTVSRMGLRGFPRGMDYIFIRPFTCLSEHVPCLSEQRWAGVDVLSRPPTGRDPRGSPSEATHLKSLRGIYGLRLRPLMNHVSSSDDPLFGVVEVG